MNNIPEPQQARILRTYLPDHVREYIDAIIKQIR